MTTSPFDIHRSKVLGHYSTASWLRSVVMAMYSGSTHPVGLSVLASIDAFKNDENLWWQVAEYTFESFMIRSRTKG